MRWDTKVKCPRCKTGTLEAYEAEHPGLDDRVMHAFICSRCENQGYWKSMAAQRRHGGRG